MQVCDIAGANRDPATRTVPEDAAVKAFFRVADALCDGGATARHVPFRDSNVTKLLAGALGGGDRLRVCFGARDGVAGDASPRERKAAFEALDAAPARRTASVLRQTGSGTFVGDAARVTTPYFFFF